MIYGCCVTGAWLTIPILTNHAWAAKPWPEFRGGTGDGVSQEHNLPVEWSEFRGVAWKTAIPGKAWSSPVIWDDLVWLSNSTEDGTRLSAVAVARDNGRIVHDITVFKQDLPCDHFRGPGSSPIIHGDLLIVALDGFDLQYVVALDKTTGKTMCRKDRNIDYGTTDGGDTFVLSAADPFTVLATNTLDDGCMASPAVFDAAIYLRTKTHLYRLGNRP